MLLTCLTEKVKWYILLKSSNVPSFHKHLMSEIFLSFCLCPSVQKIFLLIFQLSHFLFQVLLCKDQGRKGNFFAPKSTLMLIANHTKCTASLHYYFLSEKKFPQIFFSWFWKTCEGYAEVHLLNPHLWKICWEIKLPYEYIFSSLWMSVLFGMLCVLSKCSVFTQEGFWTFIWIHPCNRIMFWNAIWRKFWLDWWNEW